MRDLKSVMMVGETVGSAFTSNPKSFWKPGVMGRLEAFCNTTAAEEYVKRLRRIKGRASVICMAKTELCLFLSILGSERMQKK
jgi:hypothetical protein